MALNQPTKEEQATLLSNPNSNELSSNIALEKVEVNEESDSSAIVQGYYYYSTTNRHDNNEVLSRRFE